MFQSHEAAKLLGTTLQVKKNARFMDESRKNLLTISDGKGEDLIHIFRLDSVGFVILSADKQADPFLGFSFDNAFFKEETDFLPNFRYWTELAKEYINNATNDPLAKEKQSWREEEIKRVLNNSRTRNKMRASNIDPGDPPCNEGNYYVTKGPLLTTLWGQAHGYNDLLTHNYCTSTGNGRVLTECNATAVSQVMEYHQKPSGSFTWGSMPNSGGAFYISQLMKDAGDTLLTTYGCEVSSAYPSYIPTVLSNYGYTSYYSDFNYTMVYNDIYNNRPVILAGWESSGSGHTWVCDGSYESLSCIPPGPGNGFINAFSFAAPGVTYSSNPKMVYYIH